jgi:lipid A 3-O-deacylase
MRIRRFKALGAMLSALAAALLATAPARAEQPVAIVVSAGQFNTLREDASYETGWEAHFAPRRLARLPRFLPEVSPAVGGTATSRGTLYVYGGFRLEQPLGAAWRVALQEAAGLYYHDFGRNLGGSLEFRSGLELSRRIGLGSRVGLMVYHLSNAGFYGRNPGTESLVVTFTTKP